MYGVTCQKCSQTYSLHSNDLKELSQVDQMICVKEGLDWTKMVRITCPNCSTSALVPRMKLIWTEGTTGTVKTLEPALFEASLIDTRTLLTKAFDEPGPLFTLDRKQILTKWFENFASNIEAAQIAFQTGRDIQGHPMTGQQLFEAVERMCSEYEQGLNRLEEVCGKAVRERFEAILSRLRAELQTKTSPVTKPETGSLPGEPAKLAADVSVPLGSAAQQLIAAPLAPLVARLDALALRVLGLRHDLQITGFIISLIVAIIVGSTLDSFWIGAGVFVVVVFVIIAVIGHIEKRYVARTVVTTSKGFNITQPQTISVVEHLIKERELFKNIQDGIKSISTYQFSQDLNVRLSEAFIAAILKKEIPIILAPSRDMASLFEKLNQHKKAVELFAAGETAASSSAEEGNLFSSFAKDQEVEMKSIGFNAMVRKGRSIILAVEQVLNNRKLLFELLDKLASETKEQT